jgi:hypothetical protein
VLLSLKKKYKQLLLDQPRGGIITIGDTRKLGAKQKRLITKYETTMVYTHVINQGGKGVRSPVYF